MDKKSFFGKNDSLSTCCGMSLQNVLLQKISNFLSCNSNSTTACPVMFYSFMHFTEAFIPLDSIVWQHLD